MKTAKQYRARAAFMRRLGEDFTQEDLRVSYLKLADDFDDLASRMEDDDAEKLSKDVPADNTT